MNLRKTAKGQPCFIRVPTICNNNPETTVLCHYRLIGLSGMGIKSPDFLAAFGCSACHDAVDGRSKTHYTRDDLEAMHAHGVFRTQAYWLKEGFISVKEAK